ncbi:hypothetical protein LIA77_04055 [Sarocladium implicatum]|nr:hypothetical protein LIA77_04055 [Sarocladium implicatum]
MPTKLMHEHLRRCSQHRSLEPRRGHQRSNRQRKLLGHRHMYVDCTVKRLLIPRLDVIDSHHPALEKMYRHDRCLVRTLIDPLLILDVQPQRRVSSHPQVMLLLL